MNKITVITINYNDKFGLEKTIKSVTNQTFQNFEYIIIDGGSKDGSQAVIEQYKDKIDYWISEPDSGVFNAMNKGIKAATSDFVIFMNSGDLFFDENVISTVVNDLTDDYDIYYGDNYKVKENGSKRLKTYPEKLSFSFFYTSSINHQSTFIRKSLFEKYFYYSEDYKIASDWEFFVYTICQANVKAKYLKKTIALYDFTGISSQDKFKDLELKERAEVIEKHFPLFVKDYVQISELNSKRVQQVLHIQQYPVAWKILKSFISVILLFIPKNKK